MCAVCQTAPGARSSASRVFAFGGLLIFVHIFSFVGVLTWGNTPVLGVWFGGASDAWGYFVVWPMIASMLLLAYKFPQGPSKEMEHINRIRDSEFESIDTAEDVLETERGAGARQVRVSSQSRVYQLSMALVLLVVVLPCMAYRILIVDRMELPNHDKPRNALGVMAFNNENGWVHCALCTVHCTAQHGEPYLICRRLLCCAVSQVQHERQLQRTMLRRYRSGQRCGLRDGG